MAGRTHRLASLAAPLLLYALISVAMIGRPVIGHLGSESMGAVGDPAAFIWFLKWWPGLLAHGWSPTHSDLVWAPGGFNMTWTPTMPAAGILLAPLTEVAGPVVSYNVLTLLAPAVSGWAAFLLCRTAGAGYLPSVAGGYLFGFSSYMMGHAPAHPNLSLTAAVPLAVALVLRRLQGRLSGRWLVALLTLTLSFEFLTSTEVFLTFTIMAALSFGLAALIYRDRRRELRDVVLLAGLAYLITGLLVSPFLYASLSDPDRLTTLQPLVVSLDPVSLLVPTELTAVGGSLFTSINGRFSASPGELGSYLGPLVVLILAAFAWERRRERATLLLFGVFAAAVVLAMGARLNLLGEITAVRLPWAVFFHLPITKLVLPARIMLYAWLVVAVVAALWLSRKASAARWATVVAAAVMLLPNTGFKTPFQQYLKPGVEVSFWHSPRSAPPFFSDGTAEEMLGGRRVLVIPYGWAESSEDMLWQASAAMSFSMPEGYLGGTIPAEFLCWPVVQHMLSSQYLAQDRPGLSAFLASKGVTRVVVGDQFAAAAAPLLSRLGKPRRIGGVRLYSVPPGSRAGRCPRRS